MRGCEGRPAERMWYVREGVGKKDCVIPFGRGSGGGDGVVIFDMGLWERYGSSVLFTGLIL